jgi:CheY-like chemotaxis protein
MIDDDAGLTRAVGMIARKLGFDFQEVNRSVDAIHVFADYRPDIVLLDIIMPEKDGIDILHEILTTGRSIRIVLTSGFSESYLRLAEGVAKFHGVDLPYVLKKPFRREQLVDLLLGAARAP